LFPVGQTCLERVEKGCMASVCLYFQLHQPYRLRRYSVFDTDPFYFDDRRNVELLRRVSAKCYLPATKLMLELVNKHSGKFRLAFSLSGLVIEQLKRHQPDVIELMRELSATGCVEFLGETYHHSLACIYSKEEFRAQVDMHQRLMQELFGQTPRVFRNTELIYNNELAATLASWQRYDGVLAEGVDHILGSRSPNVPFNVPGVDGLKLLLKNYRLSDDIAFRFGNRAWSEWPLTAEKFAGWVNKINGSGSVCNVFMDYETFGEHQWAETGIFDFLRALPGEVLKNSGNDFKTPGQCAREIAATDTYDVPHMTSWADTERDLSAWLGNAMQSNALHELYKLEATVKATKDPSILADWRRLTTSDHFYYMCTKYFADGDVHKYFNPYESPYDSYINFMNVMDNLRARAESGA
jgi:alpha-amylase